MLTRKIFDPYRPSLPFGHQKPKVLLVDPSFKTIQPESLGLAYVAAAVHQAGFEVAIESFNWRGKIDDIDHFEMQEDILLAELGNRIRNEKIAIVGITAHSYDLARVIRAARVAKAAGAIVVLGGPHITAVENEPDLRGGLLWNETADILVRGYGAQVFARLIEKLTNGEPIIEIPSLSFINDGEYQITPEQSGISDLVELRPFWQVFGARLASSAYLPILSSLGCIYRCKFCTETYYDNSFWSKPPQTIIDELLQNSTIMPKFVFQDSSFTSYPQLDQILEEGVRRGLPTNLRLHAYGRVNEVLCKRDQILNLSSIGLRMLMLGIESGDNNMLRLMRKGITVEQSLEAVRSLRERSIETVGLMLVGFPGETPETITKSIDFVRKLEISPWITLWHIYHPIRESIQGFAKLPRGIDTDLPLDLFLERWGSGIEALDPLILSSAFSGRRPSPQYYSKLRGLSVIHPPSGLPFSELLRPIIS